MLSRNGSAICVTTTQAVRNVKLRRILEDALDTDLGAENYAKAALNHVAEVSVSVVA